MAQRVYREHSQETVKRISASMVEYHANRDVDSKRESARKQSDSMKRYWAGIPKRYGVQRDE
jgi:hypothetical protein